MAKDHDDSNTIILLEPFLHDFEHGTCDLLTLQILFLFFIPKSNLE